MDEIEVDLYEAEKQRRQEVLDSGEYTKVEIIVPRFEFLQGEIPKPVVSIISENSNSETIAFASIVLEQTAVDVIDYSEKAKKIKDILEVFVSQREIQTIAPGDKLKMKMDGKEGEHDTN